MTEKEKAKELVEKYRKHANGFNTAGTHDGGKYHSKKCALIAADEIIKAYEPLFTKAELKNTFWIKVKEEIKELKM